MEQWIADRVIGRFWDATKCVRCGHWHICVRGAGWMSPPTLVPTWDDSVCCWMPVYMHLMTERDGYVQCFPSKADAMKWQAKRDKVLYPSSPVRLNRKPSRVPMNFS